MKLLYTYIEEFNGIQFDLGFTFVSNKSINYSKITRTMEIKNNEVNILENIYGNNIENINIVVGENGSGKTSLLKILSTPRKNYPKDTKYFSVYELGRDKYFIEGSNLKILPVNQKEVENQYTPNDFYIICDYEKKSKKFINIHEANDEDILTTTNFIYSPNSIDNIHALTDLDDGLRPRRYRANRGDSFEKFKYISGREDMLFEKGNKTLSGMHLAISSNLDTISESFIELGFSEISKETSSNLYELDNFKYKQQLKFLKNSSLDNAVKDNKESFIIYFLKNSFINILKTKEIHSSLESYSIEDKDQIEDYLLTTKLKNYEYRTLKEYLKELISFCLNIPKSKENIGLYPDGYIEDQKNFYLKSLEGLISIFEEIPESYYKVNNLIIPFSNKKQTLSLVKNYFETINKMSSEYPLYVEIPVSSFPDFSTGQNQLISVISGIDTIVHQLSSIEYNKDRLNKIYILLDEPDTYLHPEWSRQLISFIISELKEYQEIEFNLIITTNSPFMLSDVPPSSIIKIHKDKDKRVVSNAEFGFGSNILDIVGDSFFLSDLFGQLATEKIKEVVKRINQLKMMNQNEIRKIEKIIEIIGDKVVKNTLQKMLDNQLEKLNADLFYINGKTYKLTEDDLKTAIDLLEEKLRDINDTSK